jgi:hypothetical protein
MRSSGKERAALNYRPEESPQKRFESFVWEIVTVTKEDIGAHPVGPGAEQQCP